MSDTHATTPDPPPARRRPFPWGAVVFAVACVVFGWRLGEERHFVDESAYVAQSFYADLFFEGKRDDPAWLDRAAFDVQPLAKYMVGVALRVGGYARPKPSASDAWYGNTSRRFETPQSLVAARIPMVILGAVGCVAICGIGTLAFGRAAGLVSAALLMASPDYWLHARRAMSDAPAEACGLVALALGLAAWSRFAKGQGGWRGTLGLIAGGAFAGLAVLCKLNGAIAGMVLGAWAALGLVLRGVPIRSKLGLVLATAAAGLASSGVFVALNPFLTARPEGTRTLDPMTRRIAALSFRERLKLLKDYRVGASKDGQARFPDDALTTPAARLAAIAVQGYGRFSPLGPRHSDSTRRFDWRQDWGALVWLPLVAAGAIVTYRRGWDQSRRCEPPTAWAVLVAAIVALAAVASFLPLAWDRYYLAIQPGAVLLASAALTAPSARPRREGPGAPLT